MSPLPKSPRGTSDKTSPFPYRTPSSLMLNYPLSCPLIIISLLQIAIKFQHSVLLLRDECPNLRYSSVSFSGTHSECGVIDNTPEAVKKFVCVLCWTSGCSRQVFVLKCFCSYLLTSWQPVHQTSSLIYQNKVMIFLKKRKKKEKVEQSKLQCVSATAPPISAALNMHCCPVLPSVGIN